MAEKNKAGMPFLLLESNWVGGVDCRKEGMGTWEVIEEAKTEKRKRKIIKGRKKILGCVSQPNYDYSPMESNDGEIEGIEWDREGRIFFLTFPPSPDSSSSHSI